MIKGIPAWAVRTDYGLDVKSIYPTRRGAIVNWLMAGAHNPNPILVTSSMSDIVIERLWDSRDVASAAVVKIEIREIDRG